MSDIGYAKFDFTSTNSPVILTTTSSICEGSACTTSLSVVSFLCSITFTTPLAALGGVAVGEGVIEVNVVVNVVVVVVVPSWQHTESGLRLQLTILILQIKGIWQRDCAGRSDRSRYRGRWDLEY